MSELASAMKMLSGSFPTCIMQVNHPIHKGQPNPAHGKFFMVGSIPAACYDEQRHGSYFYETEADAIEAAKAAGATRIQDTRCTFVLGH